jgi:hypothetical protein
MVLSNSSCDAEGTIANSRIIAIMDGDCDAPITSEGTLMLAYIIGTQVKLSPADFPPGTTLEQAIKDIMMQATSEFSNTMALAVRSMQSDEPNGVHVSFVASAHAGCNDCEEVSTCPMWEEANKHPVITKKQENPKLRLIRNELH